MILLFFCERKVGNGSAYGVLQHCCENIMEEKMGKGQSTIFAVAGKFFVSEKRGSGLALAVCQKAGA
jgi:hypothetical protein